MNSTSLFQGFPLGTLGNAPGVCNLSLFFFASSAFRILSIRIWKNILCSIKIRDSPSKTALVSSLSLPFDSFAFSAGVFFCFSDASSPPPSTDFPFPSLLSVLFSPSSLLSFSSFSSSFFSFFPFLLCFSSDFSVSSACSDLVLLVS